MAFFTLLAVGAPLTGALLLIVLGKRLFREQAHWLAIGAVFVSLVSSAVLFFHVALGRTLFFEPLSWIRVGTIDAPFGFAVDPLSAFMCFVVTLAATFIHVFSAGYMRGDKGYPRYFAFLNLFVFCMLMLVLANNLLVFFFFWEGVGLCSYLLIGFWHDRPSAIKASKKAFLVNRVGDACVLAGIFFVLMHFGSLRFEEIFLKLPEVSVGVTTLITLLFFAGATGKSAQIPLFTWLPDAMEGPSPVSALIHAATMVTAGVYMIARCFPLFESSPVSLGVVAWVGGITALFAATIALRQHDIKRILAYSTISQLGYMFLAMGLLLPTAALFHLATHAFFKALLFLGAGSLMHALHNETDIRKMGQLKKPLKWTWITFLIGSLALAGVPPLSGFFSKEEILKGAFANGAFLLGWIALFTAFLTAFYIFRAYFLVFHNTDRCKGGASHAHESGPAMVFALGGLAVLSVLAGVWNRDFGHFSLSHFTGAMGLADHGHHGGAEWVLFASIGASGLGVGLAYLVYGAQQLSFKNIQILGLFGKVFEKKYWVDEIYEAVITRPTLSFSRFCRVRLDQAGIDRGVGLIAETFSVGFLRLKGLASGNLQGYLLMMLATVVLILGIVVKGGL